MNFREIKKMRFVDLKNIIFEISERGYIVNIGEDMVSYNTFFVYPEVNALLNYTASSILLKIDGIRTIAEIFSETFKMYEGVTEDDYICDFIDTINHLERSGVIYSITERKRYDNIRNNSRKALQNHLRALNIGEE